MQIKRILTWPNTPTNGINPWHVILRRLVFAPFVYIGMGIVYVGFLFGWSKYDANEAWNHIF